MKLAVVPATIAGGSASPSATHGTGQVDDGAALLLGHGPVAAAAAGADAELGEGLLADGEQEHLVPSTGSQSPPMPSLRQ